MLLVTVIPITKGVFRDTLVYWSGRDVSPGAIVNVSVRSRDVPALVVYTENLEKSKAGIKKASFSLKKIKSIKGSLFLPEFVRAAEKTAEYFVAPKGRVLQAFAHKLIIENLPIKGGSLGSVEKEKQNLKTEKLIIQASKEDRLSAYKSLVREEFAKNASVLISFPTIEAVRRAEEEFSRGIADYVFSFDGNLAKKELVSRFNKSLKEKHPILILCTPGFISIPRNDLKTIIVEEENSRGYMSIGRSEFDMRYMAESYAEERGLKLIFGGNPLRAETLFRHKEKDFHDFTSVKWRDVSNVSGSVVGANPEAGKEKFKAVSNELLALVELTIRGDGRIAILSCRRGLYPSTVCSDCGYLILCDKKDGGCGTPLVLHETKNGRFFMCHKCGHGRKVLRDGEERCPKCGSWRLASLGAGIERVEEELRQAYPDTSIFRIDSDTTKTEKSIRETLRKFYSSKIAVLIGTEMMLPYLKGHLLNTAIIGLDSLLSLPDFRINEKVFSLILSLRAETRNTLLIQTQDPDRELLQLAIKGDVAGFLKLELSERKLLNYPPFSVIIRIRCKTTAQTAEKEMSFISEKLGKNHESVSYVSPNKDGQSVMAHVLLKIPREKWVDRELLATLKTFSPKYEISVNPDSVI